jgi:uncharacterized membrane protein YfcA
MASADRGAFGFADALVGKPLMTLLLGPRAAAPVMVVMGLVLSLVVGLAGRNDIDWPAVQRLLVGAIPGIGFGVWFLARVPEAWVIGAVSLLLITFSMLSLTGRLRGALSTDRWAPLFGVVSGAIGGATTMGGPPIVIYGTLRRWEPGRFRATMQAVFLITSLVMVTAQGAAGLWTRTVITVLVAGLPAILLGVWAGGIANRRFSAQRFRTAVFVLLLVLGGLLLRSAVG